MPGNKRSGTTLNDAITRYMARQRARQVSASYIRMHDMYLRQFADWCADRRKYWVAQVNTAAAEEYLYPPEGGGMADLAASSFNQQVGYLERFFRWCISIGVAEVNPFGETSRKHHHSDWAPLILSPAEMVDLLDACSSPRTRAAAAMAMNTALRSADIFRLKVGQVDMASAQISVYITKTHVRDVKPMTTDLLDEMRRYLNWYGEAVGLPVAEVPNDWALFPKLAAGAGVGFDNPKVPATARSTLITDVLASMGYPTMREGFHTLRRSAARALFEDLQASSEGRDRALLICRDFLNHSSVSQTEKYLGLSHERKARNDHLHRASFITRMAHANADSVVEGGGVSAIA